MTSDGLMLFKTKRTDENLLQRMSVHYSNPKGFVWRNICYAVIYNGVYYGHIVAGSATRFLPNRNEFIGITISELNNVVNNIFYNVSKFDGKYPIRNFTSFVVKRFVVMVVSDWYQKYGDRVYGFESLVELPRSGELYKRAGWTLIGETKGYTCKRTGGAGTDSWHGKRVWNTENLKPKLVYALRLSRVVKKIRLNK